MSYVFLRGNEISFSGLSALDDINEWITIESRVYDKPNVWHEASEITFHSRVQIIYDLAEASLVTPVSIGSFFWA